MRLTNSNTTANNNVILQFGDSSANGAAGIWAKITDHTNDYADLMLGTRNGGGFSERITIKSSGNVGIGTSAPYGNLHISHPGGTGLTNPAELRLLNSTDQGSSQIILGESDSAGEYDGMRIRYHSTSDGTYNALQVIGHDTGGDTSVHMSINRNNGYVGIGTTTPSSALHVVGTLTVAESGTNSVAIGNGNSTSAVGAIAIGVGNSAGFNTNSTAVGHSNNSTLGGSSFGRGNITSASTAIAFGDSNTVSGTDAAAFGIGISNSTANSLMIGPNDAAKVTILSSGKVGIGTTTPSELLEVIGNVKATSFISTSDVRLKTDIQPIEGLASILRLQGLRYRWRSTGEGDAGVLAQEVEKIFPDAVRTDPVTGYKGVKYLYLIAPLIESAKELYEMCKANEKLTTQQAQELASLKDENAGLRRKLDNLEKRLVDLEKKLGN
jgi:ubiquinone biosynthesis protein UbiJ